MRRRLLIMGAYSPLNRGDAAILGSMCSSARAAEPSVEITVHTFSTDVDLFQSEMGLEAHPGIFAIPVLGSSGRRLRWLVPNSVVALLLLAAGLGGRRTLAAARRVLPGGRGRALQRMLDADIVIAAGGGYLTDHYARLLPFLLLELWIASRASPALVLGAQTIGPMRSGWSRRLLEWSLEGAAEIQARDDYTVSFIADAAPALSPLVRRVPDFAFGYQTFDDALVPGRLRSQKEVLVGISVRSWSFPDSADPRAASRAYDAAFRFAIQRFVERGWGVVLVATNYPSSGSRDDDVASARTIIGSMEADLRDAICLLTDFATVAQLRSVIRACDVFIGTRMHACIFAISTGVPTLLIPYEPKGIGLMASLGRLQDVCPPDPLDGQALVLGADRLLAERDAGEVQVPRATLDQLASASRESLRRWLA